MDPYLLGQVWQGNSLGTMEQVTLRIRNAATASTSDQFTDYIVFRAIRQTLEQRLNTVGNSVIAPPDTLDWLIFNEALAGAVAALTGTPTPCPVPNTDDFLVDSTAVTYTITGVSRAIDGQSHMVSGKAQV